jgi:hypothetical protein
MDELRTQFHDARRAMIDAFIDLLTLAHEAGVAWDVQSQIQGQFWDGNVELKDAFEATNFAAKFGLWRRP